MAGRAASSPGLTARLLQPARRRFYNAGGPWYRCRLFEALGSQRYSRPALFGMDEKLAELMPWEGGTFVEAGAHDGYTQSNTYFLERFRGWSGVLIEPIPELSALCSRRRRRSKVLGCALVGDDFHGSQVTLHFGDLMSTTGDRAHAAEGLATAGRSAYEVEVPARTLTAALTEAASPPVDLMVLDLEGHELDALSGLDMDRYAPRYLLLEALEPEVQKPQFDQMLAARYAPGELASPYDLLYRRLT